MLKLRNYIKIKYLCELGIMVNLNISRAQYSKISKLLWVILIVGIEEGRYTNIPAENHLCKLCSSGTVEDEIHFVLNCDRLSDIRTKIAVPWFDTSIETQVMPDLEKMK